MSGSQQFSLTGTLQNKGIQITKTSYPNLNKGYGYISSDYKTIKIMLVSSENPTYLGTTIEPYFLEITRVSKS